MGKISIRRRSRYCGKSYVEMVFFPLNLIWVKLVTEKFLAKVASPKDT